jgi:hypothetical protein
MPGRGDLRLKRRRKVNPQEGNLFAIPLLDGSRAVGQLVERISFPGAALCAFYSYRLFPDAQANRSLDMRASEVISIQFVPIRPIEKCEWEVIGQLQPTNGHLRPDRDALRLANYVGMTVPNTNMMEAFLNAFHGLSPWEIGSDKDFLRCLSIKYEYPR